MTVQVVLAERQRLPVPKRVLPLIAVGVAKVLARTKPRHIRTVLEFARRGATPATKEQALAARRTVVSVSLRCAGQACLQRSIATALLCRARGAWPVWCTGVRTQPFAAHAWVEAEGQPVDEPFATGHYQVLLAVPPLEPATASSTGDGRYAG
jgi:transglutaminase superfamily protein